MPQDTRSSLAYALGFLMAAAAMADARARASASTGSETPHVGEKVEITLRAQNRYGNPYTEVVVWVDWKGRGFERRCYGFWEGEDVFRVRVTATAPGA